MLEQDIQVLREMVRLAENRRTEALEMIERMNRHNLALIAFAGTFLSLLISLDIPLLVTRISGGSLICTILISLFTIRPQKVSGGTPDISEDIILLRSSKYLSISSYLLDVADVTSRAGSRLHGLAAIKKKTTIFAASFLAFSLLITYILLAYAKAI